jgi:GH25 family lysozyme M1 (1,4-beta-N-acetylmuramidase)
VTIFGVDIHPNYQKGIDIARVAREGFAWVAVKASQGTSTSWAPGATVWLDQAETAGMVAFPYHYLTTAPVGSQASAAKSAARGRPLMLDVEDGSGNIEQTRSFLAACAAIGQAVPLLYLPKWYWSKIGAPNLAGLPPLVSSHYSSAGGYASSIYAGVPSTWWSDYGGGEVAVLQFTDKADVAGMKVDANAYQGTKEEFAALIGHAAPPPPPPPPPTPVRPTLHEGDSSALVWSLQLFLNRTFPAYSHIDAGPGPTSRIGPQTMAAVEEFQRRSSIPTDPPFAVGPRTWSELERFGFR